MAQHAHDVLAEQALLGAAILAHDQVRPAFLAVPEHAYYLPKHQAIASMIRMMVVREQPVDEITVMSALQDAGQLSRIGGAPYLHTVVSRPYMATNAEFYASRIVELYGRRRLWEELTRERQMLDADWESGELSRPIDASVAVLRATCDEVLNYSASTAPAEPMSLDSFLRERDTYDWLVPGLLERGDRLMLTGAEGFGKSELTTQLAMSIAGSLHPFTGEPLDGIEPRVLIIDCENQVGQSRRRFRRIAGAVDSSRAMYAAPELDWGKRVRIEFRTGGLDLLAPSDLAYLEQLLASTAPDLLVLGPLYKLHNGSVNDSEPVGQMLRSIDRLRERYGFAMLTEAHASKAQGPHGRSMEPEGSALFLRWPEFGFGLRRNSDDPENQADVVAWRGQREARDWPYTLHRRASGLLPWGPDADYYDSMRNPAEYGLHEPPERDEDLTIR
jgi:replicative DNA helicase